MEFIDDGLLIGFIFPIFLISLKDLFSLIHIYS